MQWVHGIRIPHSSRPLQESDRPRPQSHVPWARVQTRSLELLFPLGQTPKVRLVVQGGSDWACYDVTGALRRPQGQELLGRGQLGRTVPDTLCGWWCFTS